MKRDGWVPNQGLPDNWLYKRNGHSLCFCSDVGKFWKTREKALKFLKSRGENTKYDMLNSFSVSGQQQKRKESEDCWSEDETLPRGWKSAVSKDSKSRKVSRVLDPQGNCFRFRRQSLKHLIDTNGFFYKFSKITHI